MLEAGKSKDISLFVKSPSNAIEGENALINVIGVSKNRIYSNPITITTTLIGIENNPPTADFKITINNKEVTIVKVGEEIAFDASISTDEEAEIVEYLWNFGNGYVRFGEKVDYTYPKDTEPGDYIITLNVTDSNGTTTEKQMTFEILEEEEKENWLLYLILIVIVVIGILIVIMLNKVIKNLKDLEEERKTTLLTSEKVGVPSIEEERRREEQKRRDMEMWKPVKRKNEVSEVRAIRRMDKELKTDVFDSEPSKMVKGGEEEKPEPMIKVEEEKLGEREELVEEEKAGEIIKGEEENTTNKKKEKDDFWDNFQKEGEI